MSYPKSRPAVTVPSTRTKTSLRARAWPRPPRRDPHTRLIAQLLDHAGPDSSVIATSSRPWASATFVGARHVIVLKLSGAGHAARADRFIETLPDVEFSIAGHIVADTCVDERLLRSAETAGHNPAPQPGPAETVLRLCLLTIENW